MKKLILLACICIAALSLVGCGGLDYGSDCVLLNNKTTSFDLYMYVKDSNNITPQQTIKLGQMCNILKNYLKKNP